MAPAPRPSLWDKISEFLPPWTPPEVNSLMCHTSGKIVGRRGLPEEINGQRRWIHWVVAAVTAIGLLLVFSKLAQADTPARRLLPATAAATL